MELHLVDRWDYTAFIDDVLDLLLREVTKTDGFDLSSILEDLFHGTPGVEVMSVTHGH